MTTATYPFVRYSNRPTTVLSQDTLIFNHSNTCVIDSLWVSNQSNQNTLLELKLVKHGVQTSDETTLITKLLLKPYESRELTPESMFYLVPGDYLYAYTDFSGNVVTVLISYRELVNQSVGI